MMGKMSFWSERSISCSCLRLLSKKYARPPKRYKRKKFVYVRSFKMIRMGWFHFYVAVLIRKQVQLIKMPVRSSAEECVRIVQQNLATIHCATNRGLEVKPLIGTIGSSCINFTYNYTYMYEMKGNVGDLIVSYPFCQAKK